MAKRIISFGLILMMVFALFGCVDELEQYKSTAISGLTAYAEEKRAENYDAEGWSAIEQLVESGKEAVERAESKTGVESAVTETKQAIDEILTKEAMALAEAKTAGKTMIEKYGEGKGQRNYSEANWSKVIGHIRDGKAAVEGAAHKAGVEAAMAQAKEAIEGVAMEDRAVPFEISDKTTDYFAEDVDREPLFLLVRSLKELNEVAEEKEFVITPMYEEAFFEEHALILFFFLSGIYEHPLYDVRVENNYLAVYISFDAPGGLVRPMNRVWDSLIEVKNTDVTGFSDIQVRP